MCRLVSKLRLGPRGERRAEAQVAERRYAERERAQRPTLAGCERKVRLELRGLVCVDQT